MKKIYLFIYLLFFICIKSYSCDKDAYEIIYTEMVRYYGRFNGLGMAKFLAKCVCFNSVFAGKNPTEVENLRRTLDGFYVFKNCLSVIEKR